MIDQVLQELGRRIFHTPSVYCSEEGEWRDGYVKSGDRSLFQGPPMSTELEYANIWTQFRPPSLNSLTSKKTLLISSSLRSDVSRDDPHHLDLPEEDEPVRKSQNEELRIEGQDLEAHNSERDESDKTTTPRFRSMSHRYWTTLGASSIPRVVRQILVQHGFEYTEYSAENDNWLILYTPNHVKTVSLSHLKRFQKYNHFPGTWKITRKDSLGLVLADLRRRRCSLFRLETHMDFTPLTFVLPNMRKLLITAMSRDANSVWIGKPVTSSRGQGIFLMRDVSEIHSNEQIVVQRYIERPLLLDGYKFGLRIYVLVTSYAPLRIYMYREGFCLFSSTRYDSSLCNISSKRMHLTNFSVNKSSISRSATRSFAASDSTSSDKKKKKKKKKSFLSLPSVASNELDENALSRFQTHSKRLLSSTLHQIEELGANVDHLLGGISDSIIKTLIACEPTVIEQLCTIYGPRYWKRNNFFELFGFDYVIDDSFRPWLLEVNLTPSLEVVTDLDRIVKSRLVADMFSLVAIPCDGVPEFSSSPSSENFMPSVDVEEKNQRNPSVHTVSTKNGSRSSTCFDVEARHRRLRSACVSHRISLRTIGARFRDALQVGLFEQDMSHRTDFELIFPCENSEYYDAFFTKPRKINCLFRSLLFSEPRRENGGEDEDALLSTLSTELEEIVTVADKDLEDPDSETEYCEKEVSDDECDSDVGCHSGDSDEKQRYLSSHVDTSGDVVEHMSSSVSEQSSEDWPSIWTSWWESSPWNSATGMLSSALRETASRDQEELLRARSTAAIRIRDWNRQIDRDPVSTGISNELPDTIARTTKDSLSSTSSIHRMKNFRHSKSSIVVANSRRSLSSVPNVIPSSSLEVQGKLSSNLEM